MTTPSDGERAMHARGGPAHAAAPLKVAVDASWFGPAARGMARHAASLLASPRVTPVLLNQGSRLLQGRRLPQPLFEQFILGAAARSAGADAVLCPYNTAPVLAPIGVPLVTVIHDLMYLAPRTGPGGTITQRLGHAYRRLVVPRAAGRASIVVTVSGIMKAAISQRLGVDAASIHVVPNTTDPELFAPYEFVRGDRLRLLTITGTAPNKNLAALLRCVDGLLGVGLPLTMTAVGVDPREGERLCRDLGLDRVAGSVTFARGIPRHELHQLFRTASLFAMASLDEGFGIPLLEALAAGVPSVASDIPIFREIGGGDARYFDPRSPSSMRAAIEVLAREVCSSAPRQLRSPAQAAQAYAPDKIAAAASALWSAVGSC